MFRLHQASVLLTLLQQLMPSQRQLLLPEAIMKGNCRRLVQRGQVQQHVSSHNSMLLLATQSHLTVQTGSWLSILDGVVSRSGHSG